MVSYQWAYCNVSLNTLDTIGELQAQIKFPTNYIYTYLAKNNTPYNLSFYAANTLGRFDLTATVLNLSVTIQTAVHLTSKNNC